MTCESVFIAAGCLVAAAEAAVLVMLAARLASKRRDTAAKAELFERWLRHRVPGLAGVKFLDTGACVLTCKTGKSLILDARADGLLSIPLLAPAGVTHAQHAASMLDECLHACQACSIAAVPLDPKYAPADVCDVMEKGMTLDQMEVELDLSVEGAA